MSRTALERVNSQCRIAELGCGCHWVIGGTGTPETIYCMDHGKRDVLAIRPPKARETQAIQNKRSRLMVGRGIAYQ